VRMMRNKEKLKAKIMEILEDNKPTPITLKEIKEALKVTDKEWESFKEAVIELTKEGKVRMHLEIP